MMSLFWKIVDLAPKRQKGEKVGRAVGQNQLFLYLLKIGSYNFSDFLHEVQCPQGLKSDTAGFFGKILIFLKKGNKGPKMGKNGLFGLLWKIDFFFFVVDILQEVRDHLGL